MKISTVSTTYILSLDDEQKKNLSFNKKLIWQLRKAVYSSVKMYDVALNADYGISFTLYTDQDNPTNHRAIMAAAQKFFEKNR